MSPPRHGFVLLPMLLLLCLVAGLVMWTQRDASLQTAGLSHEMRLSRAQLAADAGLQHMAYQMRSVDCNGKYRTKDNPLQGPDMGGFSYTSYADNESSSPVTLTSIGSDGKVSVTVTRSNVTPVQSTVEVVILQPDSAGQDTTLDLANSGLVNQGSADRLTIQADQQVGLLKFDLSANLVPPGSTVTSARLVMRALSGGGSGNVGVYRVQSDWTEGATASTRDGNRPWVLKPGDAHDQAVTTLGYTGGLWLQWDLTDLVDRWVKGSLPNQGLLIKADSGLSGLTLASSDHAAPGLRPRLELKLQGPCNWNAPRQTAVFNAIADASLNEAATTANAGSTATLTVAKDTVSKDESRAVLQFDLSALIASSRVVKSATLRLYLSSSGAGKPLTNSVSLQIYRITNSWQESVVTWDRRNSGNSWFTAGGDRGIFVQATQTAFTGANNVWIEFDVKDLVDLWESQSSSFPNFGLVVLMPNTGSDSLLFSSRESATTPPQLVVEFE